MTDTEAGNVVSQRMGGEELRDMMLEAARKHEDCRELDDLFVFANWGFGVAGKDNRVSLACYARLNQIANSLQRKYELHPIKASRREIEGRVWSLLHDHPTVKATLSRAGGAYELATFKKLEGVPNWTMEWTTDDRMAGAAFERIIQSMQTQFELE